MKGLRKHLYWLCALSLCLTTLGGCELKKKEPISSTPKPPMNAPVPPPDQQSAEVQKKQAKDKLLSLAKAIVSDPNNWKSATAKMAEFIEPVNNLAMADDPVVDRFKEATHKLIEFSSRWINNLSDSETAKLSQATGSLEASVTTRIRAEAAIVPSVSAEAAATAKASTQSAKNEKMQELQRIVGDKLTFNDATEFSKLFKEALDAYEKLFQKLSPRQQ